MSNLFENLGMSDLQGLIGEERLKKLEELIPGILQDQTPEDIYLKRNLLKIFESFSGADLLRNKKFRKELLNHVPEEEINELCKKIRLECKKNSFNKKINKIISKPWGNNETTKIFLDFFKLPERYIPSSKIVLPNKERINFIHKPLKTLKEFQSKIYFNSIKKLEIPRIRFLIQMPTGSGKTRTAMEIISEFIKKHPKKSVLWLAHSEELCEQAIQCFVDVFSHLIPFPTDIIRTWGKNKLLIPKNPSFIVAGFQKLNLINKKNPQLIKKVSEKIGLIIVDEAHKSLAPTYFNSIRAIKGEETKIIGLTATPGRGNILGNKKLADFYHNEILEIEQGNNVSVISFLKKEKILAHIINESIITEIKYPLSTKEKEYLRKFFDFSSEFLNKVSQDEIRNIEIIKRLKKECELNKKILFFGCNVEHSKNICAMLNFLGIEAAHLDGNTSKDRRYEVISKFKEGKIQVLCNFGILTTGFDAPKVEVVFISRPTNSIVLYSQMIGRGLRGVAIGGTESCKIINVKDNIETYKSPDNVYNYFEEYWKNE